MGSVFQAGLYLDRREQPHQKSPGEHLDRVRMDGAIYTRAVKSGLNLTFNSMNVSLILGCNHNTINMVMRSSYNNPPIYYEVETQDFGPLRVARASCASEECVTTHLNEPALKWMALMRVNHLNCPCCCDARKSW